MNSIVALPELEIAVRGVALPAEALSALHEVRVRQQLSNPAQCELGFAGPADLQGVLAAAGPGAALRVNVREHAVPLFEGEVTAVELVYGPAHERQVRIRGYDVLHRLRKRQSVHAYTEVTLRDLAQEMAADIGLGVEGSDPGPLWHQVVQHQQSDLELLADLAGRCGLYFALRERVLHLFSLEGIGDPVPLALGGSLLEARVEMNGEVASSRVEATGWNPLRVEAYEDRASASRVGRRILAHVSAEQVGGTGSRTLVDRTVQDARHTEALAQAELDRRVAYEVTLWGVAGGNPRLRPGARIEVAGLDDLVAGRYVLTSVTHTIDARHGFISELSTVPPLPRDVAAGMIAALGRVTRVDDPERLGRVRVALLAYKEVESEWMHVLSAAAGPGKGLVALPDVGDRVLVLFAGGQPDMGIVLGGLYGMQGPPDSGVEGNAVRRYTLVTPGGQRVQLDDQHSAVRLEDRTGSYVELSPEAFRLHAAVDLELEAPGRSVVIRGQAIDFQRG
jgi:phage protein D/phage baseplate assembly protein gpV